MFIDALLTDRIRHRTPVFAYRVPDDRLSGAPSVPFLPGVVPLADCRFAVYREGR